MKPVRTIEWIADKQGGLVPGHVRMVDQRLLPGELVYLETRNVREIWKAIQSLQVRGAPAIGIAAAMGVVAAVQESTAQTGDELALEAVQAAGYLASSRPTAVNLFWALDRMKSLAERESNLDPKALKELLAREAVRILDEDIAMCRAIGSYGAELLKDGQTVLTHCNAGGLATSRYGTALAPIYLAYEQGKHIHVYADETRPLLQGSRLTAWELMRAGIEVTLICDNMAAQVMKEGRVDLVMVGADRIAANGDTANKIGTYGVALLAQAHGIPFYVLAPSSTFDLTLTSGDMIPIEERGSDEITRGFGKETAPADVKVYSPAFDVTPARLITAIICENGVFPPPFEEKISLNYSPLRHNKGNAERGNRNAERRKERGKFRAPSLKGNGINNDMRKETHKTLGDMGERLALQRFRDRLPTRDDVRVEAGDDCAIVSPRDPAHKHTDWLLKSDAVIEGVHFTGEDPEKAVGHKALGRALSDIAAMGGEPLWALVDIVAPPETPVARVDNVYDGLTALARRYNVAVVGGDMARGPVLELHVFCLGRVAKGKAVLRSGAKPGDSVFVTGSLGGSRMGKHLCFEPRVSEGRWLSERNWASAMIDVSDGLASDLRHLADQSRTGAELNIDAIPLSKAVMDSTDEKSARCHALTDGEDFELLFTVTPDKTNDFLTAWRKTFDLACVRIGTITEARGIIECLDANGKRTRLHESGYNHFR